MYGKVKSRMSLYKLTMTDGQRTDRQKKRLIGAQATALPTKGVQSINQINCDDEYQPSQYN